MSGPKNGESEVSLTPAKRRLFTLAMVLFPILLLFLLEFSLRLFNYGGDLNLVVKQVWGGKEVYRINRSVARRYFAQPGAIVPEPPDDPFEIRKSPNTKRIFCLGESSMAGFPFEFHATAPSFMRDRLKVWLPKYNVEVINVGLSAINTFVVEDFLVQLLAYEPDLFLIYVGHNEFYGIYGVGSSISVPGGVWLTRLNIRLLNSRTFIMVRDGYLWLRQKLSSDEKKPSPSLMGQMVGNQMIPFHSDLYETAKEIFGANLTRIIADAQQHHVPIIFSSLVCNWRGHKPFVAAFDRRTTEERRSLWQYEINAGDSAMVHDSTDNAMHLFAEAVTIDSMNATAFFKLGTALYAKGLYNDARQALIRAKDLDALRFRATTEFEQELIDVCAAHGVPVARVDSAFMSASPHGIPGDELFLEHLHPNVEGYFLMAKTFCSTIAHSGFLARADDWNMTNDLSDSAYMELSRVTDFDRTVGKVKIDLLKRRWPFETGIVNYEFKAATSVESVVFRMMKGGIAWSDARYLLADFYARNKQYDLARKECLAIAKVIPFTYEPLLRYADYYYDEGRYRDAEPAYQQCIATEENPFARMKYALILLDRGNYAGGAIQIEIALTTGPATKYTLTPNASATAQYLLGGAYAKMGKYDLARQHLQHALAINPGYKDARDLLSEIDTLR
jgi:tetratricopeptide (TPR) repeat protein